MVSNLNSNNKVFAGFEQEDISCSDSAFFVEQCVEEPEANSEAVCSGSLGNVDILRRVVDHSARSLDPSLKVLPGGVVAKHYSGGSLMPGGGRRSEIRGFSMDSRRRLRIKLMGIDWKELDFLWLTLTYHFNFGGYVDWKDDLDALVKRIERAWGQCGYSGLIWRLEFQKRGAPHYHILIGFDKGRCPKAEVFSFWLSRCWSEIVGSSDDLKHIKHGVRVQSVSQSLGLGKLLGYLVNEMGKVEQARLLDKDGVVQRTGRMWGIRGVLPFREICEISFDSEMDWQRYCDNVNKAGAGVSKYWENISPEWSGFVLMGDGVDMSKLLDGCHFHLKMSFE